ncbi:hypothetical protein ASU31_22610 [Pedobacter ginsenosidimutans]|uniref:Uncharacterized protein n=1 Tax=Pedobacter ginsenosidimutans TaxID=687842 RepID=A0A0T5VJ01_9SPHI|nr:hypothetical protein ASU31_22610 [Pedobacter ginsenosidimutans]
MTKKTLDQCLSLLNRPNYYIILPAIYITAPVIYITAPAIYIIVPAFYIIVPAFYIIAPAFYIIAPAFYIIAPAFYIIAPAFYITVHWIEEIYWDKNHIYPQPKHILNTLFWLPIFYLFTAKIVYYKCILATDNLLTRRVI